VVLPFEQTAPAQLAKACPAQSACRPLRVQQPLHHPRDRSGPVRPLMGRRFVLVASTTSAPAAGQRTPSSVAPKTRTLFYVSSRHSRARMRHSNDARRYAIGENHPPRTCGALTYLFGKKKEPKDPVNLVSYWTPGPKSSRVFHPAKKKRKTVASPTSGKKMKAEEHIPAKAGIEINSLWDVRLRHLPPSIPAAI